MADDVGEHNGLAEESLRKVTVLRLAREFQPGRMSLLPRRQNSCQATRLDKGRSVAPLNFSFPALGWSCAPLDPVSCTSIRTIGLSSAMRVHLLRLSLLVSHLNAVAFCQDPALRSQSPPYSRFSSSIMSIDPLTAMAYKGALWDCAVRSEHPGKPGLIGESVEQACSSGRRWSRGSAVTSSSRTHRSI